VDLPPYLLTHLHFCLRRTQNPGKGVASSLVQTDHLHSYSKEVFFFSPVFCHFLQRFLKTHESQFGWFFFNEKLWLSIHQISRRTFVSPYLCRKLPCITQPLQKVTFYVLALKRFFSVCYYSRSKASQKL
jgi:hypothetical protein